MLSNVLFQFILVVLVLFASVQCQRKYSHSREELKLTRNVVIGQAKCNGSQLPIAIHSAAQSSGKYYDRRQVSRMTWVRQAKERGMRPIFFIGLPNDTETQAELKLEANEYKDMVQFGFRDHYYNLTLKALAVVRWMAKNCPTADYILKTDDDVLVNVPLLEEQVKEKEFADGLTGKMMMTRSNRREGSKWFMPRDVYRYSYYRFLYGFSYLMSKNTLKKMYKVSKNLAEPVLDIDDLYMTGVVAGKARVLLYDDNRFDHYCGRDYCLMRELISFHGCQTPNQTLRVWNYWRASDDWKCPNRTSDFEFNLGNFRITFGRNFGISFNSN